MGNQQNFPMSIQHYNTNASILGYSNTIEEWNYTFFQQQKFIENMNLIVRRYDLHERREMITAQIPQDLAYFHKNFVPLHVLDEEFTKISHYLIHDTHIDEDGSQILLCAHILGGLCGRCTIVNGDHHEASVLHTAVFANSGQRKSTVNERLCAPVMDLQKKLKGECQPVMGMVSKRLINSLPHKHAKDIIKDINFDDRNSVLNAIEKANKADQFYNNLNINANNPPNILITNVTPYQLAQLMQENGEMQILASAEPDGLENLIFRKNAELVLKSYGQEPYLYSSARKRIELQHPTLNVAILGQLSSAVKLYSSPLLNSRGNTARILPSVNLGQQPKVYSTLRGNEDELYRRKITRLYEQFYTQNSDVERYCVTVEKAGGELIRDFRLELDAWGHGVASLQPWVAKLHGQALRLALAIHAWRNVDDPCGSPITKDEVEQGIFIAKCTINSAWYLYSPYGITATLDAIKIVRSFHRINGMNEQDDFIQNGTDTTKIQQRTRISRINVNNALSLLDYKGWMAVYDDGSGKFQVLPRRDFFRIPVNEL